MNLYEKLVDFVSVIVIIIVVVISMSIMGCTIIYVSSWDLYCYYYYEMYFNTYIFMGLVGIRFVGTWCLGFGTWTRARPLKIMANGRPQDP